MTPSVQPPWQAHPPLAASCPVQHSALMHCDAARGGSSAKSAIAATSAGMAATSDGMTVSTTKGASVSEALSRKSVRDAMMRADWFV